MPETEYRRIADYVDDYRRLGEGGFIQLHPNPILLRREDDVGDESEANFHTAFMKREQMADIVAAGALPPSPSRAPEARSSDRPKPHPVGEILPVVKRQGAAFQDRIGVGRARNADVCLLLPKVSKYHAFFSQGEGGSYSLTDAGSKNGTFIEDKQLAARVAVTLRDGIDLCFGPYRFTFYTADGFAAMVGRRASLR